MSDNESIKIPSIPFSLAIFVVFTISFGFAFHYQKLLRQHHHQNNRKQKQKQTFRIMTSVLCFISAIIFGITGFWKPVPIISAVICLIFGLLLLFIKSKMIATIWAVFAGIFMVIYAFVFLVASIFEYFQPEQFSQIMTSVTQNVDESTTERKVTKSVVAIELVTFIVSTIGFGLTLRYRALLKHHHQTNQDQKQKKTLKMFILMCSFFLVGVFGIDAINNKHKLMMVSTLISSIFGILLFLVESKVIATIWAVITGIFMVMSLLGSVGYIFSYFRPQSAEQMYEAFFLDDESNV